MEPKTPQRKVREQYLKKIHNNSTTITIPPSPFMKSLGYGTGVNVYRLERNDSNTTEQTASPWALKRVSQSIRKRDKEEGEMYNQRILKEAEILRTLNHPNIVGFRTIIKDERGEDTLALECCTTSLGTILEVRHDDNKGSLPAHQIKKMIGDIALALDYLHTEVKILHSDIKSFNILVKGDFDICKLCDFGVSLPLNEDGIINFAENPDLYYVGTGLWSAPEVISNENIIGSSADIFSFGLVIYETIALVPPHSLNSGISELDESTSCEEESMTSASCECYLEDSLCGTRPPLPQSFELSDEYNIIVELFYVCTNEDPSERPAAKEILRSLQNSKN